MLLNNHMEIMLPVLAKHRSSPTVIAPFIMLHLFQKMFPQRVFSPMPHSDGENDQLGYCQFNVA